MCTNFHGTSRCAKQYHSLKTSVILWPTMAFFPKHKPKASLRLIKVKLFQPGVSKHHTIQLYCNALFVQPSLHWVNPTSLLPCKVWVGVAGSSGFLVVLTELTWFGGKFFFIKCVNCTTRYSFMTLDAFRCDDDKNNNKWINKFLDGHDVWHTCRYISCTLFEHILHDFLLGSEDEIYPPETVFVWCCYRLHIITFYAKPPNPFFICYIHVFGAAQSAWYLLKSDCVMADQPHKLSAWHNCNISVSKLIR